MTTFEEAPGAGFAFDLGRAAMLEQFLGNVLEAVSVNERKLAWKAWAVSLATWALLFVVLGLGAYLVRVK